MFRAFAAVIKLVIQEREEREDASRLWHVQRVSGGKAHELACGYERAAFSEFLFKKNTTSF